MATIPMKIDNTFGAAFLGAMITAMLYGLTTLQTYFYYVFYPKDSSANKALVASIWTLDTIHMALTTVSIYHYLVSNYANPSALGIAHWSLITSVLFNVKFNDLHVLHVYLLVPIGHHRMRRAKLFHIPHILPVSQKGSMVANRHNRVNCARALRIWSSTARLLFIVTLSQLLTYYYACSYIKKELAKLPEITLIAAMPFAIFAVLSDIAIAVTLCVLLHGSRTGIKQYDEHAGYYADHILINRCLLTSVVAVIEVIVLWFLAIDFVIGKRKRFTLLRGILAFTFPPATVYANSLLATLNSRQALRGGSDVSSTMNSVHLSDMEFEHPTPNRSRNHVWTSVLPATAGHEVDAPLAGILTYMRLLPDNS
ncbi:hypothetical protein BDQ17DRAFT_1423266 [Cyathus striatus]|nr:hypothetical protein BDQ17DRAFT_1423266 [Cyathus striatus]